MQLWSATANKPGDADVAVDPCIIPAAESWILFDLRFNRSISMALPLLIHPALRLLGLASFAFADTQIVESETRELQQRIASLEAQLAACHSMNAVGSAVNGIAPPESSPLSTSSTTSASLALTGRHEGTRAASAQSLHQACRHVHHLSA